MTITDTIFRLDLDSFHQRGQTQGQSDLVQRGALHQLEGGGVDLAVVEVDLLVELHLLPLCDLQNRQRRGLRDPAERPGGGAPSSLTRQLQTV